MPPAATAAAAPKKVPIFIWEGSTKTGETKKGEMEAPDLEAAQSRLRQMGITPAKVRRKTFLDAGINIPGTGGVTTKDLVVFTRQFATMIDAGLPLVQCLEILASQSPNPAFRSVLTKIKVKVEGGSTFADALREHPKAFDQLYVNLVAAGEVGGILDTILNRLAAYIEKNEKLKRRVKGALTYPIIVLCIAVGVCAVLLLKVVPVFEKMFRDFGSALPGPTQVVVDLSHWLQHNILYLVGMVTVLVVAFQQFKKNPKGRILWDKFVFKAPLFGTLIQRVAVARFTRTLGTMISSGVPILDALEVVAKTAGNAVVEQGIRHVRSKISEGKTISQPLAETKVFPSMVVQMIGVGEATGAMDQMLNKIADFYDEEVDVAVGSLTAMIEPLMMVFLGGVVGGFLIAMYLPIFSLAGAVK